MQKLLDDFHAMGMKAEIYVDFSNRPEIVYVRFHENDDNNFYIRGYIENEHFILVKKFGAKKKSSDLGYWWNLDDAEKTYIYNEYIKMDTYIKKNLGPFT